MIDKEEVQRIKEGCWQNEAFLLEAIENTKRRYFYIGFFCGILSPLFIIIALFTQS